MGGSDKYGLTPVSKRLIGEKKRKKMDQTNEKQSWKLRYSAHKMVSSYYGPHPQETNIFFLKGEYHNQFQHKHINRKQDKPKIVTICNTASQAITESLFLAKVHQTDCRPTNVLQLMAHPNSTVPLFILSATFYSRSSQYLYKFAKVF